jgi:hypothetical protein
MKKLDRLDKKAERLMTKWRSSIDWSFSNRPGEHDYTRLEKMIAVALRREFRKYREAGE